MTAGAGAALPSVFLTKALEARLAADNLCKQQFITDFVAWKHAGADVYVFGRDADGLRHHPRLRHVHLVPLNDPVKLNRWDRDWQRYLRDRTSDRYLLYADGTPAHGYLLMLVVNDPGAHNLWTNKPLVEVLARMADDFHHFGKRPD